MAPMIYTTVFSLTKGESGVQKDVEKFCDCSDRLFMELMNTSDGECLLGMMFAGNPFTGEGVYLGDLDITPEENGREAVTIHLSEMEKVYPS